ncbi:MAG: LemA family protein [Actinomycetota bacterium]|nr:LemA family protein [Actinomycetota bacterium]
MNVRLRAQPAAVLSMLVVVVVACFFLTKVPVDGPAAPRALLWGAALLWFVWGLRLRATAWRIVDTPTSKVAAAAVGTSELAGTAIASHPAPAPASGTSCVWFSWKLQQWRKRGKDHEWVTVDSSEWRHPFVIEDDTGSIRVDPQGADFHGVKEHKYPVPGRAGKWQQLEWLVADRAQVYVLGPVRVDPTGTALEVGGDGEFMISDDSEKRIAFRFGAWAWVALVFGLAAAVVAPIFFLRTPEFGDREIGVELDGVTHLIVAAGAIYLVALAASWLLRAYNRLVIVKNQAQKAWSSIEVQLQRRFDLIRNLVTVVRGYIEHEGSLLTATAAARAQGELPSAPELHAAETHDAAAHASAQQLFALAETYPRLHADEQYERLAEALRDCENRIAFSRAFYNDAVNVMRDRRGTFPYLVVAPLVKMPTLELFETTDRDAVALGL